MNTKEAVRRACKSKRAALSVADCNTWTSMLTEQIVNTPEYKSANSIMAYLAMPKEATLDDVIRDALENGKGSKEEVRFTFKEGRNVRQLISDITSITSITEEEILDTLSDKEFLNELINEYWFLTDEILNSDIYYSLEGYLYPNTYMIYKDSSFKSVVYKMLDEMNNKLTPLKSKIENSNYTVHELLTLASIVEQEGPVGTDRYGIAGVFTNRLNDNWSLGSCVTTYYAAKVPLGDALYQKDIDDCSNKYNTRCKTYIGLPVGPICNPSIDSVEASLNPTKHNYYYFEADKNNKTYFNETYNGHLNTIERLEREGLWNEID